jgi:hypothetical protein
MQHGFWAIGEPLLEFVILVGAITALLLGPWFSIYQVRKERAKKCRSREGVI